MAKPKPLLYGPNGEEIWFFIQKQTIGFIPEYYQVLDTEGLSFVDEEDGEECECAEGSMADCVSCHEVSFDSYDEDGD